MVIRRLVVAEVVALSVVLALAVPGCGGDALDAAEPAAGPAPTQEPAGKVRTVAPGPEGLVYDPSSGSLAVAVRDPERLLILDPETLEERLSVPLPGKARHLQVTGDGLVLVPSEPANQLLEVDPEQGLVQTTAVSEYPHDASAADNGDIVVAEEFGGSASVLRDGEVVHRFDDLAQPGGVVVVGRVAVVIDVEEFTVSSYDLSVPTRVGRLDAGEGPTHVAVAGQNRVAVTDTRGDQLLLYSVEPLRLVSKFALEGRPYGITADPVSGTLWVTLTGRNEVVELSVVDDRPVEIERFPTVQQPNTVAVAPGATAVWVTGTENGEIQRIQRSTR